MPEKPISPAFGGMGRRLHSPAVPQAPPVAMFQVLVVGVTRSSNRSSWSFNCSRFVKPSQRLERNRMRPNRRSQRSVMVKPVCKGQTRPERQVSRKKLTRVLTCRSPTGDLAVKSKRVFESTNTILKVIGVNTSKTGQELPHFAK